MKRQGALRRRHIRDEEKRRARELIEEIRLENGEYGPLLKELEEGDPARAKKLEKVLSSMEHKVDSGLILLSSELYADPGSYIHELIQNADDCEYSIAHAEGRTPTLYFHLTNETLTVTSNEDGFREANVRAICDMGNSTKTDGKHTGHKGIGFKSVFASAWKVQVQSGPYSFSFTPKKVGNRRGLSLVLPANEEYQALGLDEGTRLTLHLKSQSLDQRLSEFRSLDPSIILFLKTLNKIVIKIKTSQITEEISYTREDRGVTRTIKIDTTQSGARKLVVSRYIIKSRKIHNLPVQQNGPQTSSSRVEIAFCIDDYGQPSTQTHQHRVYAGLPIRNFDFKVDINADFHVSADRQSLMNHSPRNERLQSEIAEAFCEQLCDFSGSIQTFGDLRFSWPLYYSSGRAPVNRYWLKLHSMIDRQLQEMRLFWTGSSAGRFRAREVFRVPDTYRDDDGNYLFGHLLSEDDAVQTLAPKYSDDFGPRFRRLGVKELSSQNFLEHMALDLDSEDSTYIRRYETAEDDDKDSWHQKVTDELERILESGSKYQAKLIKRLAFIPLLDGTWKSSTESIYFDSSSAGSSIPVDVELNIVRNGALPEGWKSVFQNLGISPLERADVVTKIKQMHSLAANRGTTITYDQVRDHLRYIFMNDDGNLTLDAAFHLWNHRGKMYQRETDATRRFYFRSKVNQMSYFALLKSCGSSSIQFIHPELRTLIPDDQENNHGKTWTSWLSDNVGIRSIPTLVVQPIDLPPQISPEFEHIKERYPEKITQVLWHNWSVYKNELTTLPTTEIHSIRNIQVPTAGGLLCAISETYLPTTDMGSLCKSIGVKGPLLLELEDFLNSGSSAEPRKFLVKQFGVRETLDVDFYVKALIELKNSKDQTQVDWTQVKTIYAGLNARRPELRDRIICDRLKEDFEKHSLILHYDPETQSQRWLPPSMCVWDTEDSLLTGRASIHSEYAKLKQLFHRSLNIDEPSLHMFVGTLVDKLEDHAKNEMGVVKELLMKISSVIDEDKLPSNISDDESPERHNEGYRSDGDSSLESSSSEVSWENSTISSVSSSYTDTENDDPISAHHCTEESSNESEHNEAVTKLKQRDFKFLPIRDPGGERRLASCEAAFVVPDLYQLKDEFKDDLPMLDLTLPQIRACSNLIKRLRIEDRLLSKLGKYKVYHGDACVDKKLTKVFRGKASSFCGCLKYFTKLEDEKLQTVYNRLCRVKILTCGQLRKQFHLRFESRMHKGDPTQAFCYIRKCEESTKRFDQIFLPETMVKRQRSYLTDFPEKMMELLEIQDDLEAKGVITWIVGAPTAELAQELMKQHNIPVWPSSDSYDESDEVVEYSAGEQDWPSDSNITQDVVSPASQEKISTPAGLRYSRQLPLHSRSGKADSQDEDYAKILEHVADQARTIELPKNRCSTLSNGGSDHEIKRFQDIFHKANWVKEERNFKVGAAGELFVYEILRRITHDCNTHNWTSLSRHYVSVLEDFKHVDEWEGDREVTDLQYEDKSGRLTKVLQELNYLQPGSTSRRPIYLIEVKTGVGKLESEFYVSDAQYRLIKETAMKNDQESERIYMLWRVFDVDRDRIGLRIFVDPWAARNRGLRFKQLTQWSVKVIES